VPERLATFRVETSIIENMKRIHTLARRVTSVVGKAGGTGQAEGDRKRKRRKKAKWLDASAAARPRAEGETD